MSYPSIIFAALFTGLIFADILNKRTENIAGHAFFGLLLIILTVVLSQYNADLVSWGLLIVPIAILFVSFIIVVLRGPWGSNPTPKPVTVSMGASVSDDDSECCTDTPPAPKPMQLSCTVQTPSSVPTTIPSPLTQPPGVIQGTSSTVTNQASSVNTNLSQPLSAYVNKPPATPTNLTPIKACTT